MPITLSGINTGRPEYGIGSFMQFADRAALGTTGDRGISNFFDRKYLVTSSDLMANAPGIEIPIIGDDAYEFPRQQGPLDIINGFTTPGYTENLEPLYRQLMNDNRELDVTRTATQATSDQLGYRRAVLSPTAIHAAAALVANTEFPSTSSGFTQIPEVQAPVRIALTPSATSTAKVTVVGTDYHNNRISEVIELNGTGAVAGLKWFKTVTGLTSDAGVTVAIGGTFNTGDYAYVSEFVNNDEAKLLFGMDVYIQKGRVPNTYREVYLNSLSFSISREGSVDYTWGCIGRRPVSHRFVDGTSTTPQSGTSTTRILREAFTGWQAGIFFGPSASRQRLAALEANVNITNNYEFSPVMSGIRTPGAAFRRRMNFTFSGTMQYKAADSDLINDVLGNEFLENASLDMVNATTGGFPRLCRYEFGRLQFTNVPDGTLDDEGEITRNMDMIALPSADGSKPAVKIITHTLTPLALAEISI